jgi:hypothetical protein
MCLPFPKAGYSPRDLSASVCWAPAEQSSHQPIQTLVARAVVTALPAAVDIVNASHVIAMKRGFERHPRNRASRSIRDRQAQSPDPDEHLRVMGDTALRVSELLLPARGT